MTGDTDKRRGRLEKNNIRKEDRDHGRAEGKAGDGKALKVEHIQEPGTKEDKLRVYPIIRSQSNDDSHRVKTHQDQL